MGDTLGEDNLEQIFVKHIERDEKDHELLIMMNGKLDGLSASLGTIVAIENRLRTVEETQGRHSERIDDAEREVDKLRSQSTLWAGLNSIGVVIGSALAFVFGPKG